MKKFIKRVGRLAAGEEYYQYLGRKGISPVDVIKFNKKTRRVVYIEVI